MDPKGFFSGKKDAGLKQGNYILWLPSWYPNKLQPFNGDFVQRQASAIATFFPITVFHFPQDGGPEYLSRGSEQFTSHNNLSEYICYINHKPTGLAPYNRIIFNLRFYKQAKARLLQHFSVHGLPLGVHVHIPVKAGNLAIWIKQQWNISYIISEQSSHYLPSSPDVFSSKSLPYRLQVKRIFQNASAVINVSGTIGEKIKRLFHLREVITIHNLVDTELFYFAPTPKSIFTFIHVSSLSEQKNVNGMLQAFALLAAKYTDWELKLVGPVNNPLRNLVNDLKLKDKVIFTGEVEYEEVARHMQASDAFVLFSRHENFPCVIVEALCCGLPVIASNVAGIGEAVNDKNGILVEEGNYTTLSNALEQVLRNNVAYDKEGIAAEASARFKAEVIGGQIFNLYKKYFGAGL